MSQINTVKQITALQRQPLAELQALWREIFQKAPPPYKRGYLIQRLAYRIQELAYGGLSPKSRHQLTKLGDHFEQHGKLPAQSGDNDLVEGTRLLREYQGQSHEVLVTRNGFIYDGKPYKSLSAIARAITGTRWNGLVFFGLKKQIKSIKPV
jgi:hypothetical protein